MVVLLSAEALGPELRHRPGFVAPAPPDADDRYGRSLDRACCLGREVQPSTSPGGGRCAGAPTES